MKNINAEVRNEKYIHTLEYSTSSKLYDSVIKHDCGVGQVLQNPKTFPNNSDVDYSQHRGSSDLRVQNIIYVLNMRGHPLMPTTQQKANRLLRQNKAKVIQRTPFTIQLKYPTGETKQQITLGVDSGYSKVGFSAITDKKELVAGELALRNNVSKKLTERREYRKNRRSRLWYRKPRFNNRKRKDGWLPPSIQHKLDSHIRLIKKIKEILPITKVVVEVASFDTQKMEKPEINGVEYQQGELQGYEVREYLLEKWKRKCAYCGKTNIPLEIEHIIPKTRGGTDRVSNLTISCHECNQKKGNKTAKEFGHPEIQKQAKESLKATAFMNIVRWKLVNHLNCDWTYGYITKHDRIKLGLAKSHVNDAFVIAGGNSQKRSRHFSLQQSRRNNRKLQLNRKGFKPSIRRKRHKFQPHDLIRYNGKVCVVRGTCCRGSQVLLTNKKSISPKHIELIKYGKGMVFT